MSAGKGRLPEPVHPFCGYATRADLRTWFYRSLRKGAAKMLVVIDNFDGGNYPATSCRARPTSPWRCRR
jgi:hypothetical protein